MRSANGPASTGEEALRRFSALAGDWLWVQDAQLRLTYLSSRLGDAGIDLAAYLGAKRWDQPALNLTQDDWDAHRAQIERREPFKDFEIQCLADDGRTLWLSLSGQPLLDEAGGFSGYLGIGRDVTAQKRSQQLLALEHTITQALAEAEGLDQAVSRALRHLGEAEDWDCVDFWNLDERVGTLRPVQRWSAPGIDATFGIRGRTGAVAPKPGVGLAGSVWQSGEPLWIADAMEDARAQAALVPEETGLRALLLFPVRDGGRVAGLLELSCRAVRAPEEQFLSTLHLVGRQLAGLQARASADRLRAESEARLRGLINLSADWYWESDPAHRFTRIEGRTAAGDASFSQGLVGIRRWEGDLEVDGGWEAHRALLDARKPFFDVLMWRPAREGGRRYATVSGEPRFDASGTFGGYHGVGRDVTRQKRDENMLRLEHELARTLAAAEDTESGLKAAIVSLCESEGWEAGRYYSVDEASGELRFQSGWCVNAPAMGGFIERSRAAWQSGNVAWSGELARPAGPDTSAFAFAVVSGGKPMGVLAFSGPQARSPDERLHQAARVIGAQVGQFLQRKHVEASLRESEARFRSLTQMSSDFFWETDPQHRVVSMVHGPSYPVPQMSQELTGKRLWDLPSLSPDEAGWAAHRATLDSHVPFRDFEFARAMPDGTKRYFALSGEPRLGSGGAFLGYRGVGRDVTESALTRERIASLAYRDALTGLANRTSLGPALEQAVERARRRGVKLAGVFIDLDGFKQINDLHGHDAGDRCLIEMARRLRGAVRASDVVARLGGDEFFVLLEEVLDEVAVEVVIKKLLAELVRPYELPGGAQAGLSASIGVSLFPDHAGEADALVKLADTAMYSAKQSGKNGYCIYTPPPATRERPNPAEDFASATARARVRPPSPQRPTPRPETD